VLQSCGLTQQFASGRDGQHGEHKKASVCASGLTERPHYGARRSTARAGFDGFSLSKGFMRSDLSSNGHEYSSLALAVWCMLLERSSAGGLFSL